MLQLAITTMLFLFCLAVIYGALSDLTQFTIPNWVSYGLVLLFALHTFLVWLNTPFFPSLEFRLPLWAWHVIIAVIVFVISVIFWKLRFIGGGDVKFLTATSLWMGPLHAANFMVFVTIAALALIFVLKGLTLWTPWLITSPRMPAFFKELLIRAQARELPYGVPIAIAALCFAPAMFKA